MNRKILITAALMLSIGSAPGAVYAGEPVLEQAYASAIISPMWTGMDRYSTDFSIKSGKAICAVIVESASSDKIEFSIKLQQYKSGSWKTVDSWTQKASPSGGIAKFSGSSTISKGFTYRFTGTLKTYKNGTLLDTCSITSSEEAY
ncbi:hypothetical protein FRZ06_16160 [Anoxybacterium hadale]|uniref:Uncharacterized protein n=1 Tax=Anoxybacterium hadale TaxID=3408580 RepID=A0ACD1AF09_9FIRM|nr:hypothetical protein FRZ06_16160 [Clostridiales bacterium]